MPDTNYVLLPRYFGIDTGNGIIPRGTTRRPKHDLQDEYFDEVYFNDAWLDEVERRPRLRFNPLIAALRGYHKLKERAFRTVGLQ